MNHRGYAAGLAVCLLTLTQLAVADPVYVGKTAPFSDATQIARNIIDECGLPESQMKVLHEQAKELGIEIVEDEAAVAANKGRVLLLENGEEIGNFSALRGSMGGMFGNYKGSCSVLYRCQTALAQDILRWLKNPSKDARIGE